jgi:hypothetical protein
MIVNSEGTWINAARRHAKNTGSASLVRRVVFFWLDFSLLLSLRQGKESKWYAYRWIHEPV